MKEKSVLSSNIRIVQVQGNIISDMNGEKVMFNVSKGKYYNLGSVGGEIWSLLKSPASVEEIVNTLQQQYDVSKEECEKQVVQFIEKLIREELVIVS